MLEAGVVWCGVGDKTWTIHVLVRRPCMVRHEDIPLAIAGKIKGSSLARFHGALEPLKPTNGPGELEPPIQKPRAGKPGALVESSALWCSRRMAFTTWSGALSAPGHSRTA